MKGKCAAGPTIGHLTFQRKSKHLEANHLTQLSSYFLTILSSQALHLRRVSVILISPIIPCLLDK